MAHTGCVVSAGTNYDGPLLTNIRTEPHHSAIIPTFYTYSLPVSKGHFGSASGASLKAQ